ncbi:MAG: hypothetical protein ACYTDT_07185 [Planctomycetota bacterium]
MFGSIGSTAIYFADGLPVWLLGISIPIGLIGLAVCIRIKILQRAKQCSVWWSEDDSWWIDETPTNQGK